MNWMKSALIAGGVGFVLCSMTAVMANDTRRVMGWPTVRIGNVQIMSFGLDDEETEPESDLPEPDRVPEVDQVPSVPGSHHQEIDHSEVHE